MQTRFMTKRNEVDQKLADMGIEDALKTLLNAENNKPSITAIYQQFKEESKEILESSEELQEYFSEEKFFWIFEKFFLYLSTGFDWATEQAVYCPTNFYGVVFIKAEEIIPHFMEQLLKNYKDYEGFFIENSCADFDLIAYEIQKDFDFKTE